MVVHNTHHVLPALHVMLLTMLRARILLNLSSIPQLRRRLRNRITISIVAIMSQSPTLLLESQHPPPPPGAYPENPPRQVTYEGPSSMHPTPGGNHASSSPLPAPVLDLAFYEQHGGHLSSRPVKKKNQRASMACDSCRQLKAKCDEMKPCKTCKEKDIECKYRDPEPKPYARADKAQDGILEGFGLVQTSLNSIMSHLGRVDQRLTKMESLLPKHLATSALETEPSVEDGYKRASASPCVADGASADPYYNNARHHHT
ncbi:hypothetical protein FSARC_9115 [Fusarium sarcochroum]|uniref:Zn(2)-C6 fungal-type domain-containing protein n=1 Tax=Fusarium sarcochroum TaxID=1208366 RepID=A0A8H4TRY3_9HYPO|nr:hypothetical protein FSARC_9115 [Fusarium sarcochroum]